MLPARLLCRLIPRVAPRSSTAYLSSVPEPEMKPLYLDAQVDPLLPVYETYVRICQQRDYRRDLGWVNIVTVTECQPKRGVLNINKQSKRCTIPAWVWEKYIFIYVSLKRRVKRGILENLVCIPHVSLIACRQLLQWIHECWTPCFPIR